MDKRKGKHATFVKKVTSGWRKTSLLVDTPVISCDNLPFYNYYCPLNPKTTPLTFRKTEVWLSAYHGQAPFVKK